MKSDDRASLAAQLDEFRRSHPPRTIAVSGKNWSYLVAGTGENPMMLLSGGLGSPELCFELIDSWKSRMRIVTPYYVAGRSIPETMTVLERILDAEGIDRADVLGVSFGGALAQSWLRAHPARTERVVLSHTFAPDPRYARRMSILATVARLLPLKAGKALMRRRADDLFPESFEARDFWKSFVLEIVDEMSKSYLVNLGLCLREFVGSDFTARDLEAWSGEMLVLESDDDASVKTEERARLRELYAKAQVHTFHGSGHASLIVDARRYAEIVAGFLDRT